MPEINITSVEICQEQHSWSVITRQGQRFHGRTDWHTEAEAKGQAQAISGLTGATVRTVPATVRTN